MCNCNKLQVILENSAGELARREARDEQDAQAAALELIESVPFLSDGDVIRVVQS
jgi:hypothetical protein